MLLPLTLRTSLLITAGGLAACSSTGTTKNEQCSVMLVSHSSPTLALMCQGTAPPAAPNANNMLNKVITPTGMSALIATFESEQMFQYALTSYPAGARQALQLDRDGERSVWVFSGGDQQGRHAAFVQARNYFLQLFNYARDYQPDDAAKQDMQKSRELRAERRRSRS